MFVEAVEKVKKSIFPIFFEQKIDDHKKKVGVAGTGFFIDKKGDFITGSHVIEDVEANSTLLYLGNVPYKTLAKPTKITEVKRDSRKDLFVGRVEQNKLPPLEISGSKPPVGKSLCMCGYPLANLKFIPPSTLNVDNVRVYIQPTFVLDGFRGKHSLKGIEKLWDGFVTRDISFPGMSGGPVFDEEGVVWGMDVGTLTRKIPREPDAITVINGISVGGDVLARYIKSL